MLSICRHMCKFIYFHIYALTHIHCLIHKFTETTSKIHFENSLYVHLAFISTVLPLLHKKVLSPSPLFCKTFKFLETLCCQYEHLTFAPKVQRMVWQFLYNVTTHHLLFCADQVFLILYKELYYRHVYARVQVSCRLVRFLNEFQDLC